MIRNAITCCVAVLLAGFAISGFAISGEDQAAAKTTKSNAQFERLKKLVGNWVVADKDGKPTDQVQSVFRLTGGGSALHETIFPGQAMEMVSVYHMDGDELMMTHYCALGNQPKMKADPKSKENTIHFAFAGGSNFDPAKDLHMHESTLTFINDDTLEMSGVAWDKGQPAKDHCGIMKLVRKK
jgi:hypothetical protein